MVSTGELHPALSGLDDLLRAFIAQNDACGAGVAVTVGRRLVFARGYGYADRGLERAALPSSLFRIASVSKPITAVAVLQQVEAGTIALDDRVFERLDVEPHLPDGTAPDARLAEVTIRHCLRHTGGWDRDVSYDPMFISPRICEALGIAAPADRWDIIRYMAGQPLDFGPGERYAYSNFGYCLLGRVLEAATGLAYDEYVREHVLAPLGITRMRIGRTPPELRQTDEVAYVSSEFGLAEAVVGEGKVRRPYGAWHLEAMDSHGAWIASAVDLARFVSEFAAGCDSRLLSSVAVEAMFERPPGAPGYAEDGSPKPTYYALGWSCKPVDGGLQAGHNGALDGTATGIKRRQDGVGWAVLFNQRLSPTGEHLYGALEPLLHEYCDAGPAWPEWDLFEDLA